MGVSTFVDYEDIMKYFVTFGDVLLHLSPPGVQRYEQVRSFDADYGGGESSVAVS